MLFQLMSLYCGYTGGGHWKKRKSSQKPYSQAMENWGVIKETTEL